MKLMIVGDSASGKSHFSARLSRELGIPVLHVDEIALEVGRNNRGAIREAIERELEKPKWIIDGNAFTKDLNGRLEAADVVFVFDFNRFRAFYNNTVRYLRVKFGRENMVGNRNENMGFWYFIPYVLYRFPPRKRRAIEKARAMGKKLVIFTTRDEARAFDVASLH